jgi:hypothetical protein
MHYGISSMSRFILASLIVFLWLTVAGGPVMAQAKPKSGGEAESDVQGGQRFFELDPMNIPVIRGARIRAQITFSLILELFEDTERPDVLEAMPRLRNAYLLDLKNFVDRHRKIMRSVNLPKFKKILLKSTVQILGPESVRAVLVQSVFVHRF